MIKEIEINKKNVPIEKGFNIELGKLTVIVGENNCGKTKFVETLDKKDFNAKDENDKEIIQDNIEIVYISADKIEPEENHTKTSAKGTKLFENLAKLFENINFPVEIKDQNKIEQKIDSLLDFTNQNIENFTGANIHKLEKEAETKIDLKDCLFLCIF